MAGTIRKQFRILWEEWIILVFMTLGGFLVGILLHAFIIHMDHTVTTYFPMGTVMGMIMAVMYILLLTMTQIRWYFNLEVSMGCTRARFFVSYYAVCLAVDVLGTLLLILLSTAENQLCKIWYPTLTSEFDFVPYLWKWGIFTAFLITAAGGFCGGLLIRFGRKAFWAIWAVWMVGCLGFPRVQTAMEEAPGSIFGRIGNSIAESFRAIPASILIAAAAVLIIACLAGSWAIIRRQEVTS